MRTTRSLVSVLAIAATYLEASVTFAAVPFADQAQILINKGEALAKQEEYAKAIDHYNKALVVAPGQDAPEDTLLSTAKAKGLFLTGEAQRNSGQLDQALLTYKQVLKTYTQNRYICAEASMGIAKVHQKREDYPRALEQYAEVLRHWSDKLVTADVARFRIECLRQKMKGYPSQIEAAVIGAIQLYEAAKRESEMMKNAITLAQTDARSGDVSAEKARLAALLAHPSVRGSRDMLYTLAHAQLSLSDTHNAKLTFAKYLQLAALECPPEQYRWAKADAYYKLGDYAKVISEGVDALGIYPDGAYTQEVRLYVAEAYCVLGKYDKAAVVYGGMKATTPAETAYRSGSVGRAYKRGRAWKEAARAFKQEAETKGAPADAVYGALYNLGECYYQMGDLQSACRYMTQVSAGSPDLDWARKARGQLYLWGQLGNGHGAAGR